MEFLFLFKVSEKVSCICYGITHMEEVLQYILSKKTIFIFSLELIELGVKLKENLFPFKWKIRERPPSIPPSPFFASCSIPIKCQFLGSNYPKQRPFESLFG